jgi:hypothetical protein
MPFRQHPLRIFCISSSQFLHESFVVLLFLEFISQLPAYPKYPGIVIAKV